MAWRTAWQADFVAHLQRFPMQCVVVLAGRGQEGKATLAESRHTEHTELWLHGQHGGASLDVLKSVAHGLRRRVVLMTTHEHARALQQNHPPPDWSLSFLGGRLVADVHTVNRINVSSIKRSETMQQDAT